VASLVLPGAGQLLEERRRGWVYLALEGAVWTVWGLERHQGRSDRERYRDLAWEVARQGSGARVDGDFEYYERLARWERSGAFDQDPVRPGIQPETDPSTFNGDAWALALDIFGGGGTPPQPGEPAYEAALAFYAERAYGEAYLWDWTGAPASQDRFGSLIESSDDHFRRASLWLGGALLNRVVSALDAVLAAQTRARASLAVHPGPLESRAAPSTTLQIRVILP
jgi:hypothetical protein